MSSSQRMIAISMVALLLGVVPECPNLADDRPRSLAPTDTGDFPPDELGIVEDFTSLTRVEEREIYYGLLEVARMVPLKVQKQRAREVAAAGEQAFRANPKRAKQAYSLFADLVLSPQHYRGKPVSFEGYIQKLDRMEAGDNPYGITELYQAYLFTEESKGNPIVVVCRHVPDNLPLPTKGNATNHIRVTGYFYKLWPYEAARGQWAAPLIMADRLEYRPPQPSATSELVRGGLLYGLPVGGVAVVTIVWLASRAAARRRRLEANKARKELTLPDEVATTEPGPSTR